MITIVDYGIGNLGSMFNMFKRIGVCVSIESEVSTIAKAKKIVLPGVGSFDTAMQHINTVSGLRGALDHKVLEEKVPVLGVCLGMQLLTCSSEEGNLPGLGWIPGKTRRFSKHEGLKVPHMGWNVVQTNTPSRLTSNVGKEPRYYFVHSYYVQTEDPAHAIMRTQYGLNFDSAIGRDNIYGVQFHPEKSHQFGMQILKNFSEI